MGLRDRILGKRTPEDAFAAEVTSLVRELLPVEGVTQNNDFSLGLTFTDGQTQTMFLHNIYAETAQAEGEERAARLRTAVLAMEPRERPATWDAAAPRLMPAIRAVSWATAAGVDALPLARRAFAPFLFSLTAIDDEHSLSYVTEADLEAWQIDADTVTATAVANLREHGVPVDRDGDEPRLDILGPDGYASSWLAAPDILATIGGRLDDAFVVLAPHRDELRLVGASDRAILKRELETALADYEQAPRQLSPVPYTVSDGRIVEWEPPPGDPCEAIVERARRFLAAVEYGYQQEAVQKQVDSASEDVFVATYNLSELPDGSVFSWVAWTRQVEAASIPRADCLALLDLDTKEHFRIRWEDAERVAPELSLDERHDPPRWRLGGWPEGAALEELRRAAISDPA